MISGISDRDFDILLQCFNFGEKYHKNIIFDSQNGTLTEDFLVKGGGEVAEKNV